MQQNLDRVTLSQQFSRCCSSTGSCICIKNAGGIPFTKEDGNIITDDDDEEEYNTKNYERVPVTNNSPPDEEETAAIKQQEYEDGKNRRTRN